MTANYPVAGRIGVRINPSQTSEDTLGNIVIASNGQRWMYCKAAAATPIYAVVAISNAFSAATITTTNVALAHTIGITQALLASGDYCYIPIDGSNLYALIDGTDDVLPGVGLAVSPIAAGLLSKLTASGQYLVAGIRTVTTASGTTVTTEVVLNNPHAVLSKPA